MYPLIIPLYKVELQIFYEGPVRVFDILWGLRPKDFCNFSRRIEENSSWENFSSSSLQEHKLQKNKIKQTPQLKYFVKT